MLPLREVLTLLGVVTVALAFVSMMLMVTAGAAGTDRRVIRRGIVVIWLCAIGAAGAGLVARFAMGGLLFDVDLAQARLERGSVPSWPAIPAVVVMGLLLGIALRQARLLRAGAIRFPQENDTADD